MIELFHIFLLFYLLFSEQYASGTWKSQDIHKLTKKKTIGLKFPILHSHFYYYQLSLFFLLCSFRIALTGKCFCKRALRFVKRMSTKAFCPCLHILGTLVSGLASPPVKPFNPSLSIFCSFG